MKKIDVLVNEFDYLYLDSQAGIYGGFCIY